MDQEEWALCDRNGGWEWDHWEWDVTWEGVWVMTWDLDSIPDLEQGWDLEWVMKELVWETVCSQNPGCNE